LMDGFSASDNLRVTPTGVIPEKNLMARPGFSVIMPKRP